MQSLGINGEQKRSTYLKRLGLAKNLISGYLELPNECRAPFERFLADHVQSKDGMRSYLPFSTDCEDSGMPWLTDEQLGFYVYEAWFHWALEIKVASLNDFERLEAVTGMLGTLIRLKYRRRLRSIELRKTATW